MSLLTWRKYNIQFHCFADDVQTYLPLKADKNDSVQVLLECMQEVQSWMHQNFLKLNHSKTEIILFNSHSDTANFNSSIGPLSSYCHSSGRNLGVIFYNDFKLAL